MSNHIAIDLGAESGRVMLGRVGERIELEEVHRWPEHQHTVDGLERWDIDAIEREIEHGIRITLGAGEPVASVSVDSWGVDYVHLLADGSRVADPVMYRAAPTEKAYASVVKHDGRRQRMYAATGIQFMPFNSIFQWIASLPAFSNRANLLLIADYLNWRLAGGTVDDARQEVSLASTTQAYDPRRRGWARDLLGEYGIVTMGLPELVQAGTPLGRLRTPEVAPSGSDVKVIATCSHDTAAAVAGTPLNDGYAYLSSGTWSLLGVEVDEPVTSEVARKHNFTNEVGFGHTIRLLKNLSGLFLVQEARKDLPGDPSYAELAESAAKAPASRSLIRPDAPQFAKVGGLLKSIRDYCAATDQPTPESAGEVVRCCYESLALLYAQTLDQLAELIGTRPSGLNIVGGGSNIDLLNQLAADACGVAVEAGPAEATAIGNVGIQAIVAGTVADLPSLRRLIRHSFDTKTFRPVGDLADAAKRFAALPTQ